jgi:hypothetical protein
MYTGPVPPQPLPTELSSQPNELPMGQSIRVIPFNEDNYKPWDQKMDPRSRVNFAKLYTVEHNVKVEQFGYVDPGDEWKLTAQFNNHWGRPGAELLPPTDKNSAYHPLAGNYPTQGSFVPQGASSMSGYAPEPTSGYSSYGSSAQPAPGFQYGAPPLEADTMAGSQEAAYGQPGMYQQQPPGPIQRFPPVPNPYYQYPRQQYPPGGSGPNYQHRSRGSRGSGSQW